jgi:hypothetical protein
MPRSKKAAKGKQVVEEVASKEIPSDACKAFMTECIAKFYESETTVSLDTKYVRYGEECPSKFKANMTQRMLNALNVPQWHHEMEKRGFNKCLENKVHYAL